MPIFPTVPAPGHPHASAADPAPAAAPGGHAKATAAADLSQLPTGRGHGAKPRGKWRRNGEKLVKKERNMVKIGEKIAKNGEHMVNTW